MDISAISLSGLPVADRASQLATQTELRQSQQATQAETGARAQDAASQVASIQRLPDLEGSETSSDESAEGETRGGNLDVYA